MKKIQCELCGSNDIVKTGDFFECQYCGAKYTPEGAKTLMVEGTIKIDNSEEIKNLYDNGRRYFKQGIYDEAMFCYDLLCVYDGNNWEPQFYVILCKILMSQMPENYDSLKALHTATANAFVLVGDEENTLKDKAKDLEEIMLRCSEVAETIRAQASGLITQYRSNKQYKDADIVLEAVSVCIGLTYKTIGEGLSQYIKFDDDYAETGKEKALEFMERGRKMMYEDAKRCKSAVKANGLRYDADKYFIDKIKALKPSYDPEILRKKLGPSIFDMFR